jgi:DNA-binding GntR family transcriptional regulator
MSIIRSTPVATQVNEVLRERIRTAVYIPGARLPSESDLADEFDVSRATIRTVLASMAAEGLILRKQGDGTYVNQHIQDVNTHLGGLWEFGRLIESSGYRSAIKALSVETRPATETELEQLVLQPGAEVLVLKRLFFADNNPVIFATNAIPAALIAKASDPIDGNLDIREILGRYCQKKIAFAISDVRSSLANGEVSEILMCEPGAPLLRILITFYDRDSQPLVCGESYYDDATLRLRLVQTWG